MLSNAVKIHPFHLPPLVLVISLGLASPALISPAFAQTTPKTTAEAATNTVKTYRINAGTLDAALAQFGQQSGVLVSVSGEVSQGKSSKGLNIRLSVAQALQQLLEGTDLHAEPRGNGSYVIVGPEADTTLMFAPVKVSANAMNATTEGTGSYTTGIITTSTKLNLSPRETPQSISVITRQNMDDQHMVTIEDAMRNTPGVIESKSGPERSSFYARGFRITNITYDGLPTNMDTSSYGSDVLLSDLAIYDRVEVVRGAAGLTQGAGNPSAAINLVRKRPTHDFMASITGSAGSWNRYGIEADISGSLTENKSLRGRLVTSYRDEDSFQDEVSRERQVWYAITEADLGDRTLLTIGASQQENDNHTSWGGLPAAAGGSDLKLSRSTYLGNDWDQWDKLSTTYFASLEHNFDNDWNLKFSATSVKAKLKLFGTQARYNASSDQYDQAAGEYHYTDKQNSYEVYANGPFNLLGRKHELVAGISQRDGDFDGFGGGATVFTNMDISNWDHSLVAKPDLNLNSWFSRSQDEQSSTFITTRLNLADSLKLIIGSRLDWYEFQGESRWSTYDYKITRHLTQYAGLIYDLDERHSAYASYTDIFKPQNRHDASTKLLDPIVGKNYEVGIKGEYFDGAINASIALFEIDQKNIAMLEGDQSICSSYPDNSCYRAAGLVKSQGVDVEIQGALTPNWQLTAGFTYVDKEIKKDDDPANIGERADTYLPRQQFSVSTLYHLSDKWRVGGNLRWQSEIHYSGNEFRSQQNDYAVIGLVAGHRVNQNIDIQLNVNNVFDKTYYQGISPSARNPYNIYGDPRNFMLTAKYTF